MRPLLCIDVDGVLCPFWPTDGCERFFTSAGDWVWIRRSEGDRLRRLREHFNLVWATGWEHDANSEIAPFLDIHAFPVIEFTGTNYMDQDWKFADIQRYCDGLPFIWIDDLISDESIQWASDRAIPTLFIRTDCDLGITDEHEAQMMEFLNEVELWHSS